MLLQFDYNIISVVLCCVVLCGKLTSFCYICVKGPTLKTEVVNFVASLNFSFVQVARRALARYLATIARLSQLTTQLSNAKSPSQSYANTRK